MTYEETLHYLYTSIPVFQPTGAAAYKPGLATSIALDDYLGNPHKAYRTIHVGGTNGKGSVSHLLSAILQQSGYKVGLYTSPHLLDFRERIRVNGKMISKDYVINFIEQHRSFFEPLSPSFFELTSSMAFEYFRAEEVDFAVIEVGLGGRLDSTNIITPILSIITNISLDHMQYLGDTVEKIAAEKAGIIKPGIPALIGETYADSVSKVFTDTASAAGAPIRFAQGVKVMNESQLTETGIWHFDSVEFGLLSGELGGAVQCKNAQTVLVALNLLKSKGVAILPEAVKEGFKHVVELTGLMGRWQVLQDSPLVMCDTGHNVGGWEYLQIHLGEVAKRHKQLYMIVGMVNDKDIDGVLELMPPNAFYFFTQASVERAMPAEEFAAHAASKGLSGMICHRVANAVSEALAKATDDDAIFIGGSTFIVADALPLFHKHHE
ncbi:MAG: folylpolyglutamate synthase/dihydrofolate synthase family protein [Tannerellaceae bacterium]